MKIGLTFDLRSWYIDRGYSLDETAEFDKQETVDALENSLKLMGYETEPVGNTFQLIEALAAGRISCSCYSGSIQNTIRFQRAGYYGTFSE
jgi:D-alanine-D-alanine ligase